MKKQFKGQPPLVDYALWEEVEWPAGRAAALVIFHRIK